MTDATAPFPIKRVMIASESNNLEKTRILTKDLPSSLGENEIRLAVDKVGLSANNKFYLDYGSKPPFSFFEAWPLEDKGLVNAPAWGIATVIESNNPEIKVDEKYRGFLHMTNCVQLEAKKTPTGFKAIRPKVAQAYNGFETVIKSSVLASADMTKSDVALAAFPGFITGFGLCENCKREAFYGATSIVFTSASSKVSLATAFFLKQAKNELDASATTTFPSIIGYTSSSNIEFVKMTDLYDTVLSYDEDVPSTEDKLLYIDVSGKATTFESNKDKIVKCLVVGNAHGVPDSSSTFSCFSFIGKIKMAMSLMGMPTWIHGWIRPQLELFLIVDESQRLAQEWGQKEFEERVDAAFFAFVDAAVDKKWIGVHRCETFETIQEAFVKICKGRVPPSEAIVLDVAKAAQQK